MVKGPEELSKLRPDDEAAVKAIEDYLDESAEFRGFDGTDIKIVLGPDLCRKHLGVRSITRIRALYERLRAAGWQEVSSSGSWNERVGLTLSLSQHKRIYSSSLD